MRLSEDRVGTFDGEQAYSMGVGVVSCALPWMSKAEDASD